MRPYKPILTERAVSVFCCAIIFVLASAPLIWGQQMFRASIGFPYIYQRVLTVANSSGAVIATTYSASYTFDHAALVTAGKSLSSGKDVRVFHSSGSTWTELDRAVDLSAGWNTATTKIWFRVQVAIANGNSDSNYRFYYGYPAAPVPVYDWHTVTVAAEDYSLQQARSALDTTISGNHSTFLSDGTDWWQSSVHYPITWTSDLWSAITARPSSFTASQINNLVVKFVAAKDGNGDLPVGLYRDSTPIYYAGIDTLHAYVTGDGWGYIPLLTLVAYQKSLDLTTFNSVSAALKVALQRVPLDPTNHLVNVATGSEWVPWGYEDNTKFGGGVNLAGSLQFYAACSAMVTLYTAAGDSTNAALFTGYASDIAANIDVLWSASDGMYLAALGYNSQIAVTGSAYAVSLGLASTHATSISNYLVANYATLTYAGYFRTSPTNWQRKWDATAFPNGTYLDGFWPYGIRWILPTMALTSPSTAQTAAAAFSGGANLTQEYYDQDHSVNPLSSPDLLTPPSHVLIFITSRPDLFPAVNASGQKADYSNVFSLWDDMSSFSAQWLWGTGWGYQHADGTIRALTGPFSVNGIGVALDRALGFSDNVAVQMDLYVDNYTSGDVLLGGVCVSASGLVYTTVLGYCSGIRANDATHWPIVDLAVAFSPGTLLSWTTGTWYRTQIARVGSTIYRKTWLAGGAEPGTWQETYAQSNNRTGTHLLYLGAYSATRIDNLLVRRFVLTEPATTAGSETLTYGRQLP